VGRCELSVMLIGHCQIIAFRYIVEMPTNPYRCCDAGHSHFITTKLSVPADLKNTPVLGAASRGLIPDHDLCPPAHVGLTLLPAAVDLDFDGVL
jgi:hypothetical protein